MDQGQQPRQDPGYDRALRRLDVARCKPAGDRRAKGRRRLERPDHRGILRPRREGLAGRAHRDHAAAQARGCRRRQVPQGGACQIPTRLTWLADVPADVAARCRIEIAGLRKSFLAEGREVVAVDNASFRIHDGEFVALLGPSGCGKSTILNMVATLIAPNGGDIRVDDPPVIPGPPIPQGRYALQKDTLFPWRAVAGKIGYALVLARVPGAGPRCREDHAAPPGRLDA